MILDIKPIRTPALRMKEDIYATFLNYIGRDYMLLLSSAWGFRVNVDNVKCVHEYINLEESSLEYCLDNYFGINMDLVTYNDISDYLKDIYNSLRENVPVVLNVSSIGLPYHRTYMNPETAHEHPILLIGCDEEAVYILDPPWTLDIVKLEIKELEKILLSIEKFYIRNTSTDTEINRVLRTMLDKVERKDDIGDMFDSIYYFASIIEKNLIYL